jgi:hypothetical protein
MDVILHIGAHRSGVTAMGRYMADHAAHFRAARICHWGPERLRRGLMHGLQPTPVPALARNGRQRGLGRVRLSLADEAARGTRRLWLSDPHLLGSARESLGWGALYLGAGVRLARYFEAFDGAVSDVVLSIRSPVQFWPTVMAGMLVRGAPMPSPERLAKLADMNRSWRDVITDVACAVPGARLWIAPFERFADQPDALYHAVTGEPAPRAAGYAIHDSMPRLEDLAAAGIAGLPDGDADGRWTPFAAAQSARLREAYADDLMWLEAGADGLAWLLDAPNKIPVAKNRPDYGQTEGRDTHDGQGRVAGHSDR